MKNAEWVIKSGYNFDDVICCGTDSGDAYIISLNGEYSKLVHGISSFRAFRSWLDMEHEEPILDDAEKRYLKGVIRPFRDKVLYIIKSRTIVPGEEYISLHFAECEVTCLPCFKEGSMYKGMEEDKMYTPEELGIL